MKKLEVGKIIKTHGIKGEVKVLSTTSFPEQRFVKGNTLYIEKNNKLLPITIDSVRFHQNCPLITFNNITNINDCLEYIGLSLYVDKEMLEQLPEDEFYIDDLIGLDVFVDDEKIGVVSDVLEVPQGEIIQIIKNDQSKSLVPFVNEFIKEVDLENKKIIITPIEGLL